MTPALSASVVIFLAALAANAPFMSQRLGLCGPRVAHKSIKLRIIELIGTYFLVGIIALVIENHLGQIAP